MELLWIILFVVLILSINYWFSKKEHFLDVDNSEEPVADQSTSEEQSE
jgi:hypothetical protein